LSACLLKTCSENSENIRCLLACPFKNVFFSGMGMKLSMQKLTMQLNRICMLLKKQSCSAVNNAIKLLARKVSLTYIWEFIQVKSQTVAQCVANPFHRAVPLISIQEFTLAKNLSVVHCVTNHLHVVTP
jgi:hypothetical protein